jgi:hypothetical protein
MGQGLTATTQGHGFHRQNFLHVTKNGNVTVTNAERKTYDEYNTKTGKWERKLKPGESHTPSPDRQDHLNITKNGNMTVTNPARKTYDEYNPQNGTWQRHLKPGQHHGK